jgi:Flp pilus assembly protein TadG
MKSFRNEEGSALVEFGISSAVLFMTLFGLMACCTVLYSYIFVSEAAREASRYAIVRGSSCVGLSDCPNIDSAKLNTYVKNLSYPGINKGNLSASATFTPDKSPGSVVSVTVTYNMALNIPFWPKTGRALQLSSTSAMAISQ